MCIVLTCLSQSLGRVDAGYPIGCEPQVSSMPLEKLAETVTASIDVQSAQEVKTCYSQTSHVVRSQEGSDGLITVATLA